MGLDLDEMTCAILQFIKEQLLVSIEQIKGTQLRLDIEVKCILSDKH